MRQNWFFISAATQRISEEISGSAPQALV